jgi:hypothetical protein
MSRAVHPSTGWVTWRSEHAPGSTDHRERGPVTAVEEGEGVPDILVEGLLDQVPVLAGPRSVADLPGGLTNRNLRVTTRAVSLPPSEPR